MAKSAYTPSSVVGRQRMGPAGRLAYLLVLACAIVASIGPVVWILLSSFKSNTQIFSLDSLLLPRPGTTQGYVDAFVQIDLASFLTNSLLYATSGALLASLLAFLVAYPCARFQFSARTVIVAAITVALAIPAVGLIVPEFYIMLRLGLYDTKYGLSLFYGAILFPLAFVILRAYLETMPRSIEEAATVDGAGYFSLLFRIVLPIARPALATVSAIVFIFVWNDFLWNLVLAPSNQNAQAAMTGFRSQFGVNVAGMLAAATIVMLVPMLVFVALQRRVMEALTAGWEK